MIRASSFWFIWSFGMFLCLLVLAGCASDFARHGSFYRMATVEIEDNSGLGTGVVVSPHQVLTAYHVVQRRLGDLTVTFGDGAKATGTIEWFDEGLDIAVIQVLAAGVGRTHYHRRLSAWRRLVDDGRPDRKHLRRRPPR